VNIRRLLSVTLVFALFVAALPAPCRAQSEEEPEEEEPIQSRPNPLDKGSASLQFLQTAFTGLKANHLQQLRAGRTLGLKASRALNLSQLGFSCAKGDVVMVALSDKGLKLRGTDKGAKGIIIHDLVGKQALSLKSLATGKTLRGTTALNKAGALSISGIPVEAAPAMRTGMMH